MNKEQVAQKLAEKIGVTKKDAVESIDALIEIISEELVAGESVNIVNFGKFEAKMRKERVGRNPQTKEEMTIEAQRTVRFQVGKGLKERVKQG